MSLRGFSTDLRDKTRNSIVVVESIDALPEPVANVITFEDNKILWRLSQPLTLDPDVRFVIPSGFEVFFIGENTAEHRIFCNLSGTLPLFSGDVGRFESERVSFINTNTGNGRLFDFSPVTAARPVLSLEKGFASGFGSIGTVRECLNIGENFAFVSNGGPLVINNAGKGANVGVEFNALNFESHTGTHIEFTGTSKTIDITSTFAKPANGDQVFDLSAVTLNSTTNIDPEFQSIDTSLGGTTGLDVTYSSDTTLTYLYRYVTGDSTSAEVTLTMPDSTQGFGKIIDITKTLGATNDLIVAADSGKKINNQDAICLRGAKGPSLTLRSNSTGWAII